MIKKILMVCVGNICRSPMAEALLMHKLIEKYPETCVSSAGLGALVGWPADQFTVDLMQEKGLDISGHRARQLSPQLLLDSDIIFTMTARQQQQIECSLTSIKGRVHRLGEWAAYDVPDPYQRPKEAFVQALALIEEGIEDWCMRLWT